eukprot:gene25906-biopygen13564
MDSAVVRPVVHSGPGRGRRPGLQNDWPPPRRGAVAIAQALSLSEPEPERSPMVQEPKAPPEGRGTTNGTGSANSLSVQAWSFVVRLRRQQRRRPCIKNDTERVGV